MVSPHRTIRICNTLGNVKKTANLRQGYDWQASRVFWLCRSGSNRFRRLFAVPTYWEYAPRAKTARRSVAAFFNIPFSCILGMEGCRFFSCVVDCSHILRDPLPRSVMLLWAIRELLAYLVPKTMDLNIIARWNDLRSHACPTHRLTPFIIDNFPLCSMSNVLEHS